MELRWGSRWFWKQEEFRRFRFRCRLLGSAKRKWKILRLRMIPFQVLRAHILALWPKQVPQPKTTMSLRNFCLLSQEDAQSSPAPDGVTTIAPCFTVWLIPDSLQQSTIGIIFQLIKSWQRGNQVLWLSSVEVVHTVTVPSETKKTAGPTPLISQSKAKSVTKRLMKSTRLGEWHS